MHWLFLQQISDILYHNFYDYTFTQSLVVDLKVTLILGPFSLYGK
jgi:hypothetical protein